MGQDVQLFALRRRFREQGKHGKPFISIAVVKM